MAIRVLLHQLDPDLPAPTQGNPGDAGWDLRARASIVIEPGERALIPTGIAIALPPGFVALVHPRSGLAWKDGLTLVNAPGTVDAAYRGEISVVAMNLDPRMPISITRGDRIAQLVVQRVEDVEWVPVGDLPSSRRGTGGFGSSGTH